MIATVFKRSYGLHPALQQLPPALDRRQRRDLLMEHNLDQLALPMGSVPPAPTALAIVGLPSRPARTVMAASASAAARSEPWQAMSASLSARRLIASVASPWALSKSSAGHSSARAYPLANLDGEIGDSLPRP